MTEQENLKAFQEKIGYFFKDEKLLFEALSHSSFANEKKGRRSNERLEFLGDSVLSIVVSNYIFHHQQQMPEGQLSKLRASLVCEKALFEFSKEIDLGEHILLGKGEERTGGRQRPSIVSDAFEAVIAAIYLDGGIEPATKHIMRFLPKDFKTTRPASFVDYKTILQEVVQKNPEERVDVPWVTIGQQADSSQAFGSGLTYSMRYFLLKYFNIVTPDDDVDNWRSKQRAAEAAEDLAIAKQIIEELDKDVKAFLTKNPDKSDAVKELMSKYVKNSNYFAITESALATKLLTEFRETFVKEG